VGPNDRSSTVVLIVDGDIEVAACVLDPAPDPDLDFVDALARLSLAMRRRGWAVRLRNPDRELCELLDLVGLADVFR
jgi:hypothetical protein